MKKIFYILTLLGVVAHGQNQKDSLKSNKLDEVFIETPRLVKSKKEIPQQIEKITKNELLFQNFQNTGDILGNTGLSAVQKSQQGGGSPVIRGFEASRILLLVDGIRMNNLIFRAGHLQNILTVDPFALENMEVFFGPSSTLFGSDALGGAINMQTIYAKTHNQIGRKFSGRAFTRYATVNSEKAAHFDLNYASKNWGSLTSFSYNDFGDLKMGKKKNGNNSYFGEREQYIETVDGIDYIVENKNKYVQKFSGYKQYNLLQKLTLKNQKSTHDLNLQFSTTSDIPRYDRLTDPSPTGLRNAEWYYGPQRRILVAYTFSDEKIIFGSDLKATVSYQNNQESRHNRRFQNYNLQSRTENVNAFALNLDLNRSFFNGNLFYGIESYYDKLKSSAESRNIQTGDIKPLDTRYPNGSNNMFRNDLYISYNSKLNSKTNWNIGARGGYAILNSTINDDSVFKLPFNEIQQQNFTYSGSLGLVYNPSKIARLTVNFGSGYRVPNIDDLAKIFESGNGTVIVPNENLKPEKTITSDFGLGIFSSNKRFSFENTYFYTRFFDAIVTDIYNYQGQSTIDYNGSISQVMANQNKKRAFITGISSTFKGYLVDNLLLTANFNYTLGRINSNDQNQPLDHIPPYYGKIALNYQNKYFTAEAYLLYNGKKDIDSYFPNGEDNEQYAPEGGMPSWETYNFKASVNLLKNLTFSSGIENILDTQYRTFASGINAPGRNVYGGLNYTF